MESSEPGRPRYAPTSNRHGPSSSLASINTQASAASSAPRFDDIDHRGRDPAEKSFPQDGYSMATAGAVPANTPYRPHTTLSYSSTYSSINGVQSAVENRRTSDESDSVSIHRRGQQADRSLPSLQEALNSSTPIGAASESREVIRSLPPPHSFPPRPTPSESRSSFTSSSRPPLSARSKVPPPLHLYDRAQPATQGYVGRDRDVDYRPSGEPAPPQLSGGYSHYSQQHLPVSQHAPPLYPPQPGQRPAGQLSLPSFPPASPRQPRSVIESPLSHGRPPYQPDEEFSRSKHEATLGRPFDAYPYVDALNKIALSSRIIFNFAEAFDVAAREPTGGTQLPSRLPNESEITVMMENVTNIRQCLDDVKSMIKHSRLHSERARDMAREAPVHRPLEEEDVHMYSDVSKAPQQQHHAQHPHHSLHHPPSYTLAEVKKRRGVSLEPPAPSAAPRVTDPPRKRAAPPGRCHSCNRVDTPEWRRGPDGARTLCNACGLHYAKLERKRQSEQRSIRPKPAHDT